jgi:DNA polymerase-3 subunit epsilon
MSSDNLIAVLDVETTGLSPGRYDRIIEVGLVLITPDGEPVDEYETLINPGRDLGPTHLHRITGSDVANAPSFADIAGDLLERIRKAEVIAGHNISFDRDFIVKEYERLGVNLPEFPTLCTCQKLGRTNLATCCSEFGIPFDFQAHRALHDARATARLVLELHRHDPVILSEAAPRPLAWPHLEPKNTSPVTREDAATVADETPRFLQRIASRVHHDTDGDQADILAYMTLIDRILEDRVIDDEEEQTLVDAATNWNLSTERIEAAHRDYLHSLAIAALADGVVTESELRDLHDVARLLGQDREELNEMLQRALRQLGTGPKVDANRGSDIAPSLIGKTVCFTGQLQAKLDGQPIKRQLAEELAKRAGLNIASSVTKKLDVLVVADPQTQSSKAKKARSYGVRILADSVFWKMIGVAVD